MARTASSLQPFSAETAALEKLFQRYITMIKEYELARIQTELKKNDERRLKRFITAFKVDAFREDSIASYLQGLIDRYETTGMTKKDKHSLEKKLHDLMVVPLLDPGTRDYIDVPWNSFKEFYRNSYNEVRGMYKKLNAFCKTRPAGSCTGRYAVCSMRTLCRQLSAHMEKELSLKGKKKKEFVDNRDISSYLDHKMLESVRKSVRHQ